MSKKRKKNHPNRLKQSARLRLNFRLVAVAATMTVAVVVGGIIYFNISNSKKSKASTTTSNAELRPVDFNIPELKNNFREETISGISVRKMKDEHVTN
ncbi:MAG: hypothetical protein V9G42_08975 [Bacteroidia bacterium]